jgi:histidinol-phosphate phosphatase family protein
MDKPKQAVILAGGRGSRLGALTEAVPKPMIRFHGKPFLEYVIENIRGEGITRVLLLLGYRAEAIRAHFGDGRAMGVTIEYSVTPVENETGPRLRAAREQLDSVFLLMYCDNYWPANLDAMTAHFAARSRAQAQITVYTNPDGYTRNNTQYDASGMVVNYDKTRSSPGLNAVEIGYALVRRSVLNGLPDGNVNFESCIYRQLTSCGELAAFPTGHRYYSIGSIERLSRTEAFLCRRPAVILDRDGVLNVKAPQGQYVRSWREFQWLPGAIDAVRLLTQRGYTVVVITNQAGIARGMMTTEEVVTLHECMQKSLRSNGASVDAIYYCPHGWDAGCFCRKPQPGMLFQAQRDLNLDLTRTWVVGDDDRDLQAARAAGSPALLVTPEWPLLRLVRERILQL